jgi:membrane associated rhomboid family serine protease
MPLPYSQPEGEILPPPTDPTLTDSAPAEAYSPEQARRRREYSDWDPRSAPGTYLLLAINCAVYLWMVTHGVGLGTPSDNALLHFGANETDLVLQHGQWYRLLTATFVHVGWLHLGTNMWCLWNLGMLGEPLIGPYGMVAVYMLTGIAGNLLSMGSSVVLDHIYNAPEFLKIPGAGASGAVFGIAGILIVLLSNRRLPFPWEVLRSLRRRVIQFAGINLVIGIAVNQLPAGIQIDNSAHIGGFLSGLALGVPLVPRMTAGRERYLSRQKVTFAAACFLLALFGYSIANML